MVTLIEVDSHAICTCNCSHLACAITSHIVHATHTSIVRLSIHIETRVR